MSLLDTMKATLAQYASGTASPDQAASHFDQLSQSADAGTLAHGIEEALRSNQTPPFAQIVSQLYTSGSAEQKTAMLNALMANASPEQRAQLENLQRSTGAGASSAGSSVPPDDVGTIARGVEQHDPSIVEKMSEFYAQHPTLFRTLGSAAMMIAMRKIAERHR